MTSRLGQRGSRIGILLLVLFAPLAWPMAWAEEEPAIAAVRVVGARRYPEPRVLNEIKTRPGQPYRPAVIREDVRKLDSLQWYYSVAAEEERTADGIIVTFRVVERATVTEIVYEGAKHLDKDELLGITGLRRGGPMSVALNKRAAQAIEKKYQEKGRHFASVELVEGGKDEDTKVHFRITEGPVVRVRNIHFEGSQFVTGSRLKTQIDSDEAILRMVSGKYHPELLEQDLQKLIEYYHNFGYFDVKINRYVKWNEGYETVDLHFVVDEGVRYRVKDVEIAGNSKVDSAILLATNKVEKDQPFNGTVMQASVKKMNDEYGKRGYVTARVNPDLRFKETPGDVSVVYQVTEGPPARVGEIYIVGNNVTEERVIRRQMTVFPGQILSTPDLRISERNLNRLNIFKFKPEEGIMPTVTVLNPDDDNQFKNILVQVEEDRTGTITFGVGINSDAGANASIVITERNFDIFRIPKCWDDIAENRAFRGAGQEFQAQIMPGTEVTRFTVSFREPYLFDSPYALGLAGYLNYRQYDEYDEQRGGGRISLTHRFNTLWSAGVGFRAEDVLIKNVPPWAPKDLTSVQGHSTVLAPKLSVTRDCRDSFIRPTEGNLFDISYEQAFGDFTFPVLNVEDSQFFTLYERPDGSGRHVLALRGQLSWAGDDAPVFERFYAGGFRTLRGFDFRGVSPIKQGFRVGGQFQALGSVEYQIPIMANDKLWAVVFSDFGTVENDIELRDIRASVGFGLRMVVPMFGPVPIALDFAYPLRKEPGDDTQIVSFWVGFFSR